MFPVGNEVGISYLFLVAVIMLLYEGTRIIHNNKKTDLPKNKPSLWDKDSVENNKH